MSSQGIRGSVFCDWSLLWMIALFFGVQAAASPVGATLNPVDTDQIQERSWPNWFQGELIEGGSLLSTAIFNGLAQISLYDPSFSSPFESRQVQVGRVVYDNEDVANTYSVVDHVQLNLQVPVYMKSLLHGTRTVNWGLGTTEGLIINDIRQSRRKEITEFYTDLPTLQGSVQKWYDGTLAASSAPKSSIQNSAPTTNGANTTEVVTPNQNTADGSNDFWGSLTSWDPLRTAQYSQLWNIFAFPIRIPFKADGLKNLDEGEIISYNANGTVALSINIGWNFDPTSLTNLAQVGAGLSTYLEGEFEIAILKENERYAQVKVNRVFKHGYDESFGGQEQKDLIRGFILHRQINVSQTIIPFQFAADQNTGHTFDVGYRFDMNDPLARESYEKAVLGNFVSAETLCVRPIGSNETPSVQKVFTVDSSDTAKSSSDEFKIGFLLSSQQSDGVAISDAKIILPDGTTNVLQAITTDEDDNSFLLGSTSKFRYKYTVYLDEDGYAQGKDGSFRLMAEGFLDDTATHGDTLHEYMDEVEGIVGVAGIFPRPPVKTPAAPGENWWQQILDLFNSSFVAYGHSSFYYRLSMTQAQTLEFINTPDDEIWPIMEQAYGVPPGTWANLWDRSIYGLTDDLKQFLSMNWLVTFSLPDTTSLPRLAYASAFANGWSKLHQEMGEKDPVALSKGLADLFSSRWFSFEQMKALRLALIKDSMGYIASGSNHTFGYIWQQKNVIADSTVFQKLSKAENFDQPWNQTSMDLDSMVTGVQVVVGDAGDMRVSFGTKIVPEFVYFRINEVGFFTNPTRTELTLDNRNGQFVAGANLLLIDPAHGQVDQNILKQLVAGHKYILSLAVSRDGNTWGARSDQTFVYSPPDRRPD